MKKKEVKKIEEKVKESGERKAKEVNVRFKRMNAPEEKKVIKRKINYKNLSIIFIGLIIVAIIFFITRGVVETGMTFLIVSFAIGGYFFMAGRLVASARIRKIELIFPDFVELMASNLRSGMTIDEALLLSSRKEFAPLDEEVLLLGKEIVTGREISIALLRMADRIKSEKIKKTVTVVISGIRSGGNLAVLLEETAINMRERNFIEKKAASSVLMYMIFVLFAVSAGAPALFALSSVLVSVLTNLISNLPQIDTSTLGLPVTITSISIPIDFVIYFSVVFIITTCILASMLLGLINKGEEKEGFKYILPLIVVSLTVYFTIRLVLLKYVLGSLI
ncbi:MAG: type II secretion system F family protein [Nanoarchaeota archaeon]